MYVIIHLVNGKTTTRKLEISKDAIVNHMARRNIFIKGYTLTNAI